MKLHLLEHDPEDISHTNITIWAAKKGYEISKTDVSNTEELPRPTDFDWLMVMGGFQHVWDDETNPWLIPEKKLISDSVISGKIILGICFGAQLLAEVLGGQIFPNKHREIGWHEVSLTPEGRDSFLFTNVPKKFVTFHWHSDHFSLPRRCARLAFSEPTANQAFICNDSPLVGLQFHPECTCDTVKFYSKEFGNEWEPGPFVAGQDAVMAGTELIPDTYWLMDTLLNNMDREWGYDSKLCKKS